MATSSTATLQPIAIIGIGIRAPGDGSDPEAFWDMLVKGQSARTEIPKDRYNVDGFFHPDPERLGSIQPRSVTLLLVGLLHDDIEYLCEREAEEQ